MANQFGYLQHGEAGTAMRTERVPVRCEHSDKWQAYYEGKWRRVYISVKALFVRHKNAKIKIIIEGVTLVNSRQVKNCSTEGCHCKSMSGLKKPVCRYCWAKGLWGEEWADSCFPEYKEGKK